MLLIGIVLIVAGIALLWVAADPFVNAAASLARIWGVSPVLVGALVIGFGTSVPELVVSGWAAGQGELASSVGNVIGSNAANLSLVLGASVVISPVVFRVPVVRREGVVTLLAMVAAVLVVWDDYLHFAEGIGLLAGMAVVSGLLVRWSRRDVADNQVSHPVGEDDVLGDQRASRQLLRALASLVAIVVGARLLVDGGVYVAEHYGLAGGFVGATIFALGTSLPELVTAGAAARRKANELLIGNLLGSNLFNSLLVVGTVGVIGAGTIGERRVPEQLVMVLIGLLVMIMAITRRRMGRAQSLVLLGSFAVFMLVVLQNTQA